MNTLNRVDAPSSPPLPLYPLPTSVAYLQQPTSPNECSNTEGINTFTGSDNQVPFIQGPPLIELLN